MSGNKNKYGYDFVPLEELNERGTLLGRVGYKPVRSVYYLSFAAAVFLLIGHLFGILMAIICGIGACFIQFYIKDHPVMDVYDDGLIFYHPADPSQGVRYSLDEVERWSVNKDNSYQISVTMKDMNIHVAFSYQVAAANRLLRKVMPEKSTMNVVIRMNRAKGGLFRKKK